MDCIENFGIGKSGHVFGKKVINNGTEGGDIMYNVYKRPTKLKNSNKRSTFNNNSNVSDQYCKETERKIRFGFWRPQKCR